MEAVLATLRQAIPSAEQHGSVSQHQCGYEVLPVRIHKEHPELDEGIRPLKKQRLADGFNEDEAVIPENHVIDSETEISIGGNEIVEVCEDGQENLETQESIVTETIDLQTWGCVYFGFIRCDEEFSTNRCVRDRYCLKNSYFIKILRVSTMHITVVL